MLCACPTFQFCANSGTRTHIQCKRSGTVTDNLAAGYRAHREPSKGFLTLFQKKHSQRVVHSVRSSILMGREGLSHFSYSDCLVTPLLTHRLRPTPSRSSPSWKSSTRSRFARPVSSAVLVCACVLCIRVRTRNPVQFFSLSAASETRHCCLGRVMRHATCARNSLMIPSCLPCNQSSLAFLLTHPQPFGSLFPFAQACSSPASCSTSSVCDCRSPHGRPLARIRPFFLYPV